MKEIFIIRHGETDYNLQNIVQGRGVDSSLNETGKQQAKAFFNYYKDYPFEIIYISTLQRTKQTVQPFIDAGLRYEIAPELDEISWGIFEGKVQDETVKKEFYRILDKWKKGDLDCCPENGETPNQIKERQLTLIDRLINSHEQKILVCTHGRAIRALLCNMLGKSLCEMETFPHNNLSLYKLVYNKGRFEIEIFNNREHLNAKN